MRVNKKSTVTFLKLVGTGIVMALLIRALLQFIGQAIPTKVLSIIVIYITYKLFCCTLKVIKLLAKIAMAVLIIYILIF